MVTCTRRSPPPYRLRSSEQANQPVHRRPQLTHATKPREQNGVAWGVVTLDRAARKGLLEEVTSICGGSGESTLWGPGERAFQTEGLDVQRPWGRTRVFRTRLQKVPLCSYSPPLKCGHHRGILHLLGRTELWRATGWRTKGFLCPSATDFHSPGGRVAEESQSLREGRQRRPAAWPQGGESPGARSPGLTAFQVARGTLKSKTRGWNVPSTGPWKREWGPRRLCGAAEGSGHLGKGPGQREGGWSRRGGAERPRRLLPLVCERPEPLGCALAWVGRGTPESRPHTAVHTASGSKCGSRSRVGSARLRWELDFYVDGPDSPIQMQWPLQPPVYPWTWRHKGCGRTARGRFPLAAAALPGTEWRGRGYEACRAGETRWAVLEWRWPPKAVAVSRSLL